MKIIHILNTNSFSGAENVVCQIISMLKNEKDIESYYCSLEGPVRNILEQKGINFIPIKKMNSREVKRAISRVNADIIHAHDMRATYVASKACRDIPLISHIHNNAFNSRRLSLKSIAFLFASIKCEHIFWVSDSSYKDYYFKKFTMNKSSILYNIVDIVALQNKVLHIKNAPKYDVIYLGRLSDEKDPKRFIMVVKKIVIKNNSAKIVIVGNGNLEKEVKELAIKLGISKNIDFVGFQENPHIYLKQSKVLVMTSKWEGIPMGALEALSLGVPIVSTPTDGLTKIIINNKCGFLSNDDDILADKINILISNSKLHKDFSFAAYERAIELNNVNKYKQQLLNVYVSVAIRKKKR